jgi:photosystem II stability/assembly factor-like uncharacterized protein
MRQRVDTSTASRAHETPGKSWTTGGKCGAATFIVVAFAVAAFVGIGDSTGKASPGRASGPHGPSARAASSSLGPLPPDAGLPEAIAFDPRSPEVVYLMTPGHVFKATDGGSHWQATATRGSGWVGANETLTADPRRSGTLYAGTQAGVYKTVDGGRSWRLSKRGLFVPHPGERLMGWVIALAVDPANVNVVYAGSDRISKSSDGGRSWKTVFAPHRAPGLRANVSALAIAPGRPETIYAIARVGTGITSIVESTDAGATWHASTSVRGVNDAGFATALAVDPRHPSTVYAAISANVLKTTDAGKTWKPIARGLPIAARRSEGGCYCRGGVTALAIDPRRTGTVYAALTQGGIYKTANGGRTWSHAFYQRSRIYVVAVDPARPATIYAAGDGSWNASLSSTAPRILRSTNGGRSWTMSAPTSKGEK